MGGTVPYNHIREVHCKGVKSHIEEMIIQDREICETQKKT